MSRRSRAATATSGVLTERWGWQPTAWMEEGLPTWRWRSAPRGLVTRRQMRAEGLAPGGRSPVARVVCRRGRRWALLWERSELVTKRVPSAAQLDAVAAALAARRWCPACRRDVGYCIPTSVGVCGRCDPELEIAAMRPATRAVDTSLSKAAPRAAAGSVAEVAAGTPTDAARDWLGGAA